MKYFSILENVPLIFCWKKNIYFPFKPHHRFLTFFNVTKSVVEWTQEARCLGIIFWINPQRLEDTPNIRCSVMKFWHFSTKMEPNSWHLMEKWYIYSKDRHTWIGNREYINMSLMVENKWRNICAIFRQLLIFFFFNRMTEKQSCWMETTRLLMRAPGIQVATPLL